ncbi:hypothetical protein ACROYT_G000966 [Oculina patagonica]
MTSDEEKKRWLVVGVAMVDVMAPALRDTVKQGMDLHYNNLDAYLRGLLVPFSLNTLTYSQASKDRTLQSLKFENINNNSQTHGKSKKNYNYSVSSSVDLAKLYLPDYLATFSAFDESLDLSAIVRLLGWSRPAPIFPSPNPLLCLQQAANDVRHNRNKWAHPNLIEWTQAFFNDCFSKLEDLVKSVSLGHKEKETLEQLSYWRKEGCQMIMVDQKLLTLVQQSWELLRKELAAFQETVTSLQDQQQSLEGNVEEHQQKLDEISAQQAEQAMQIGALVQLQDENYTRMLEMFESLKEQMRQESLHVRPFDLETFRAKLADRYRRTATVPTSVWSTKSKVDIRKVYTRLSMKKEKETVQVDYTKLFMKTKNGLVPKRILVEGQAGIGKSTFVKKLTLDWVEPDETSMSEETNHLKKFELVLFIKLRDVSHCQTLRDVIRCSGLLSKEDEELTDTLLGYIRENQSNVLLVFDGYDEYGKGSDSQVFDVLKSDYLPDCCVLMTSRSSQADDIREFADVQATVTGFNREDIEKYLAKRLGEAEAKDLVKHLEKQRLTDTAKVPLLALFFSILWKQGKAELISGTRTKVFNEIVRCILDYDHGKCTPPQFKTIEESKDILVELGKVALEGLLKDDLLFEYGKLAAIKSEVNVIHAFLQITEEAEEVRPTERVSFIHKTIQEFLAALYIDSQYVPEGSLGPLQELANNFEKCLHFENVFQFVSGLSDHGAVVVLDHFFAIKVTDPTLDLSKTIILPGTSEQTCYDVTDRQRRFHDLVFAAFGEAQCKEGLLRRCVLCTSGMVLLSEQLVQDLLEVNNVTTEMQSGAIIFRKLQWDFHYSLGENLRMFLDSLDVAVKITERSEVLHLGDFYRKFLNCGFLCMCNFSAILLVNADRLSFYITDLVVACSFHGLLFTGTPVGPDPFYDLVAERINNDQEYRQSLRLEHLIPFSFPFPARDDTRSPVAELNLEPVESCLNYLQSIECVSTSSREVHVLHQLGVSAAKSRYLNYVDLQVDCDVYHFLEQAMETNNRSLQLSIRHSQTCTPAGAKKLAILLPKFSNISALSLNLKHCTDEAVRSLADAITHTSLKVLCLKEVDLTDDAAMVLGRSVCQMSDLEVLIINGKNNNLRCPQMQALFGGISREWPLRELELSCFRVERAGLVFLRESFKFFPRLQVLQLNRLAMNANDVCYLINDVSFPELLQLDLSGNQLGHGITSIKEHIACLPNLDQLVLYNAGCSEEDINSINEAVKKVRPMFNVFTMSGLEQMW